MVPNKLKDWFRRQLFTAREEGNCIRFCVRHIGAGKTGMGDVDTMDVPKVKDELDEAFVEMIAIRFYESAQSDADGLTGVQSYAICSFFEEDPQKSLARFTLRLSSQVEEMEGSEDPSHSEPANKDGMVAQAMRHTEALMRMATQGTQQQINSMQRQIQSKDEMIEKLTHDRLETFRLVEDLSSRKHERDIENQQEERKFKIQAEMIDRITPLFPVVLAKLTGTKMLPAGSGASEGMKSLMQSITPEQFEALMQVFRPEQTIALSAMMQEIQKDEKDETKNN